MVCESATTIYRVTTVKRGAITFVAVDGGMGDNLEVALFDQRFEAGIVGRFDGPDPERVTVVGRHCESGDVLVDGVDLSGPRWATCSPYPRRARTASRWRTTTTATAGSRWSSRATASPGSSSAGRPGTT